MRGWFPGIAAWRRSVSIRMAWRSGSASRSLEEGILLVDPDVDRDMFGESDSNSARSASWSGIF